MPVPVFGTISRLRLTVQLVMLGVTVYGGALVGSYMAQKISNALPALSCAYDQQNGAYCALIPFQHIMHHRVGEGIARAGALTLEMLLPLAFTLLTFFLFFVVLSKAFCGWICPLGTLQELLYKAGRRLALPIHRLTGGRLEKVRPVKWGLLLVLVFLLPAMAGLGWLPHAFGDPFCQICPSRIATTLLTADVNQIAAPTDDMLSLGFVALRNALFGFVVIAALTLRQPFCRICPMLALHAALRRLAPLRLAKKHHDRCAKCGLCAKACPMDIPEVASCSGSAAYHADCTLCGRCVEFCPDDGVLALKLGPVPLAVSSKEAFRRRTRSEKPDGTPVTVKVRVKEPV